jgi:hypothetical protein
MNDAGNFISTLIEGPLSYISVTLIVSGVPVHVLHEEITSPVYWHGAFFLPCDTKAKQTPEPPSQGR